VARSEFSDATGQYMHKARIASLVQQVRALRLAIDTGEARACA
jgi:hypothetical protein